MSRINSDVLLKGMIDPLRASSTHDQWNRMEDHAVVLAFPSLGVPSVQLLYLFFTVNCAGTRYNCPQGRGRPDTHILES